MTRSRIVLISVVLFATISRGAAIDLSKWKYMADMTVNDSNGQYCALLVTPELYNIARTDLSDIRLMGADGQQIPYIMTQQRDTAETVKYSPNLINRSTDANSNVCITLDFGDLTQKNCIEVETSGNNFRRPVRVEGSGDNVQYFTIIERAYVFAIDDAGHHRFSKINLPDNDFRYLRIAVSPMPVQDSTFSINDVRAFKIVEKKAERQTLKMMQIEHSQDVNTGSSVYVFDLNWCNLPVVEIDLSSPDTSFYRCVTVYGRNAVTRKVKIESEDNRERFTESPVPWNHITSDTIYNYADNAGKKHERLAVPVGSGSSYRYIKIEIKNYDDRPIVINSASAKMIPSKIVFPTPKENTAKLYVGCDSAGSPQYDLARRLADSAQAVKAKSGLEAFVENPAFAQIANKLPWTEQHKSIMLAVLVLVVIVLGVFIMKSMKSISKQ